MRAVSIAGSWPAAGQPFTVAELDRMPDDGRRYELLDGALVVSPRPTTVHQLAAARLVITLGNACPDGLCVLAEPAVQLTADTEFDPDVVVVRQQDVGGPKLLRPPLLAIEIRSPSTALIDLNHKMAAYQRFGVQSYWIINPDPGLPSLDAYELRDGRYARTASVTGCRAFRAERPFPAEIVPARLLAGLT